MTEAMEIVDHDREQRQKLWQKLITAGNCDRCNGSSKLLQGKVTSAMAVIDHF